MLLHWLKSFFKDELWVCIHPRHMALMRTTRLLSNGLKRQIVDAQVINLPRNNMDKNHESQGWETVVRSLKHALNDPKWQGTLSTVIISNDYVKFSVIPWNAELISEVEKQAYLQHCFNLAYGEPAKAWDLRMNIPEFDKPTIASAVPIDLVQALHDVYAESGMELSAIYPQLMLAINQTLSEISQHKMAQSFWLVAVQNGRICLMLLVDGSWRLVKNVAVAADFSTQIAALIQREVVNNNLQVEMPILLYWPEYKEVSAFQLANHCVINIHPHQFDKEIIHASTRYSQGEPA